MMATPPARYALNWNPGVAGRLASGSEDGRICVWDVEAAGLDPAGVAPVLSLEAHEHGVEVSTDLICTDLLRLSQYSYLSFL